MKRDQRGFSGVEGLIALVLLLVVGLTGWYVWKLNHQAKPVPSSSVVVNNTGSKASKASADPTADWQAYTSTSGHFSFKYPKNWTFKSCEQLVLLSNKEPVGNCASEGFGQMAIYSNPGDLRHDDFFKTGFVNVSETPVTVDGMAGMRQTGKASGQSEGLGALDDGTVVTRYVFYAHGRTYVALYQQTPAYPDALAGFETLVTKTLQLSA